LGHSFEVTILLEALTRPEVLPGDAFEPAAGFRADAVRQRRVSITRLCTNGRDVQGSGSEGV